MQDALLLKRRQRNARVQQRARRRVVVAGGFESGKSSAINAMLRRPLLPCNPGPAARPLIRIIDAPILRITADPNSEHARSIGEMADVVDDTEIETCEVACPIGLLAGVEIIELPSHSDGSVSDAHVAMMAQADLLIWVTIASQAWRLSEQTVIEKLPEAARKTSILAVSRADKLRKAADLDKIETRLQDEASPYFGELVFMQASVHNLDRSADDERLWSRTGGAALAAIAQDLVTV